MLFYSRYVSPRRRAQRTLELLGLCCAEKFPWQDERTHPDEEIRTNAKVQVTDDIREWDYGNYEGLTSAQVREQRKKSGEAVWDIWRDGCPGGEYVQSFVSMTRTKEITDFGIRHHIRSPKDVTERLDRLIDEIRTKYQKDVIGKHKSEGVSGDVLVVAHGHILRAFAMRWINQELTNGVSLLLDGIFHPCPFSI